MFVTHAGIIGTCIVCWIIQSVSSTLLNMNTKSVYGKKFDISLETDEEDINDNLDDAFELAGQLAVEEETDEESDHETTECRCRRLGSRLLKATQFDTQMQSTSFERYDEHG